MRKLLVLFAVLLISTVAAAQVYPPELAGSRATFGPEMVRFEVTSVAGCPFSHTELAQYYWLAQLTVGPSEAGIDLLGFFAPSGRQIAPPAPSLFIPFDEDADCYLSVSNEFKFEALTFDGTWFTLRSGYFVPQPHCCPWFLFHESQCLWTMLAMDVIPYRVPYEMPVAVE